MDGTVQQVEAHADLVRDAAASARVELHDTGGGAGDADTRR